MGRKEQLSAKRLEVLNIIKLKCEAFGIKDFDYIITDDNHEILRIESIKIGCDCNSLFAIESELVGCLFVCYFKERDLGAFKKQTFNQIKRYWF